MDIILPSVLRLAVGAAAAAVLGGGYSLRPGLDLDQLLLERDAAARYARGVSEENAGEEERERVGVPCVLDGGEERDPAYGRTGRRWGPT